MTRPEETIIWSRLTSLSELSRWFSLADAPLLFRCARDASFVPGVEGIAVGLLKALVASASTVRVEWDYDCANEDPPPVAASLFALQLHEAASSIKDKYNTEMRQELKGLTWGRVRKQQGMVTGPETCYLVSRDPIAPLPACLAEEGLFVNRGAFRRVLQAALQKFQKSRLFFGDEDDLVTFFYESARNAHEHGRLLEDSNGDGVRGVIFQRTRSVDRRSWPEYLRDYVAKVRPQVGDGRLMSCTVCDFGLGIQHTLPRLPDETAWSALNRAFLKGQSRKTAGSDVEQGLGLSKLRAAATKLRAFLMVRSADLLGFRDFSSDCRPDNDLLAPWPERFQFGMFGTSLTIFWLEPEREPELFPS